MRVIKIISLLYMFFSLFVGVCFCDILKNIQESKLSNMYVFDGCLFYKGSPNRIICAYNHKLDQKSPYTDLSPYELFELKCNNVKLIYYSPCLSQSKANNSEENLKFEKNLGYLASCDIAICADVLGANLYPVSTNDVNVIEDSSSAGLWSDAVAGLDTNSAKDVIDLARAWDIRLELILENRIVSWGNYFCDVSGVKVADNPIFGVWAFESNWLDRMLAGDWRGLPDFFIDELNKEWNNWVYNEIAKTTSEFKAKYQFLVKGESIEEESLKLVAEEKHPEIKNSKKWITLGEQTREIYKKSPRAELQREFFVQLYLKHIMRLKSKFAVLGKVTRDAPYFITMSANDKTNLQTSDLSLNSSVSSYVYQYSGFTENQNDGSLAASKEFFKQDALLYNASIIMMPNSLLKNITPFTLGLLQFANTTHPMSVDKFGVESTKISFIEETVNLELNGSQTKLVDGIEFKILDSTSSNEPINVVNSAEDASKEEAQNNTFKLSLKYIKFERNPAQKPSSPRFVFLEYDKKMAKHIQLHIFGEALANYSLVADVDNSEKPFDKYKFDDRGAIKLHLNRGYSLLILTEDFKKIFPLDF